MGCKVPELYIYMFHQHITSCSKGCGSSHLQTGSPVWLDTSQGLMESLHYPFWLWHSRFATKGGPGLCGEIGQVPVELDRGWRGVGVSVKLLCVCMHSHKMCPHGHSQPVCCLPLHPLTTGIINMDSRKETHSQGAHSQYNWRIIYGVLWPSVAKSDLLLSDCCPRSEELHP